MDLLDTQKLNDFLEKQPEVKKQYLLNQTIIDFNFIPEEYQIKAQQLFQDLQLKIV